MSVYSHAQLERYFDRVHLPHARRVYNVSSLDPADQLAFLALIQTHNLCAVPFENLNLHYSQHHQISLDPDVLFHKQVETPGRGGYCMENNGLLNIVLRSLGFNVYSAGARVNGGASYNGWSHMINLVTIGDQKYMVDVGFGPNGATRPLPLKKDASDDFTHIAPASMRLVWKNLAENTDPTQRLWVYQHRIDNGSAFQDMYCFTELEFLPQDYFLMNYFTSTHPKIWFTQKVICSKMIMGGSGKDAIIGVIILQDNVKMRSNGKTEVQEEFKSEDDRVSALERRFGISLSRNECKGIRGMISEIRQAA